MITATELQELSRQLKMLTLPEPPAVKELVKETRDRQFSLWALFIGLFRETPARKKAERM